MKVEVIKRLYASEVFQRENAEIGSRLMHLGGYPPNGIVTKMHIPIM